MTSSSYFNFVFLDDPTRVSPLLANISELKKLIGNEYLCTGFVDYIIQCSIDNRDNNDTIIASNLSLSLMQSYLKNNEENGEVVSQHVKMTLWNTYQYYSTKGFRIFSMVCMKHHFFLVSLKFNAADANVPIFSDVHAYDSMKLVVRER
jgi:hypothetical protein